MTEAGLLQPSFSATSSAIRYQYQRRLHRYQQGHVLNTMHIKFCSRDSMNSKFIEIWKNVSCAINTPIVRAASLVRKTIVLILLGFWRFDRSLDQRWNSPSPQAKMRQPFVNWRIRLQKSTSSMQKTCLYIDAIVRPSLNQTGVIRLQNHFRCQNHWFITIT